MHAVWDLQGSSWKQNASKKDHLERMLNGSEVITGIWASGILLKEHNLLHIMQNSSDFFFCMITETKVNDFWKEFSKKCADLCCFGFSSEVTVLIFGFIISFESRSTNRIIIGERPL